MIDVFEEIARFDDQVQPESTRILDLNALTDGDYDFEIVEVKPDRTEKTRDAVLRFRVKPLTGNTKGVIVERVYFLGTEKNLSNLGTDLCMLGFDADKWKPPQRPFSKELAACVGKLKGLRFRGRKSTNRVGEGQAAKTYHNLEIYSRLTIGSAPPPTQAPPGTAPTAPSAKPPAQPPAPPNTTTTGGEDDDGIPF